MSEIKKVVLAYSGGFDEGDYLLGTSIAWPLIATCLVEIARNTDGDAISHGTTGKGNDQAPCERHLAGTAHC